MEIDPYTIYCSWSDHQTEVFLNVFGSCAAHCLFTYRANLSLQDDLSTGQLSVKAHGPLVSHMLNDRKWIFVYNCSDFKIEVDFEII